MAVTSLGATDGPLAAGVTPVSVSSADANSLLRRLEGLIAVDANKMPSQVVLPGEGSAARAVGADMGLEPVGVMRRHVRLEIVSSSKA
jgi:hypothetical protein